MTFLSAVFFADFINQFSSLLKLNHVKGDVRGA